MKTYKSTTQHTAQVPMTVTKAADTLAAICNREDTAQVVGDRALRKHSHGYHVPIDQDAMGFIIGRELAESFHATMRLPAYKEYFEKINARLVQGGITLAHSSEYWFLHKLPRFDPEDELLYIYSHQSLINQAPAGFQPS